MLVSFCLTPADNNALRTLFIVAEFVFSAASAVWLVVSTPSVRITLSGFTLIVADPGTDKVVLLVTLLFVFCVVARQKASAATATTAVPVVVIMLFINLLARFLV